MPDRIFILNGPSYGDAIEGLGDQVYQLSEFLDTPETFKLVLFTGGEDVTPHFYGETSPKGLCKCNPKRDKTERIIFKTALRHGIKMAGICRGFQFLNVMAGGKLLHHINGHGGTYHDFECRKDDKTRRVNSLHHQMVIPPKDGIIVGWSPIKLSDIYIGDKDENVNWPGPEVEAAIFPRVNACGVQWHPEMMKPYEDGYMFFHDMIRMFLLLGSDDLVSLYTGKPRRVKAAV